MLFSSLSLRVPHSHLDKKEEFLFFSTLSPSPFPTTYGSASIASAVIWGKFYMVDAERRLLENALQDPDNHQFVILSDSFKDPGPHNNGSACIPCKCAKGLSIAMAEKHNLKNPAVKRILQEVKEMQMNPSDDYISLPLEENIFEWKFSIRGPGDSEFEGGIYHGRIQLPSEYPFKPPSFMLLTPGLEGRNCIADEHYLPTFLQVRI
ncbi:hypothetical protein Fmac_009273 [Flemingia macrophylla]|uniref:UBC core domain-containing protein n=1 Tax=Flemingia macrophylla TaxID=520843 RepID=A0ABD1MZV9_9FABA